MLFNQNFYIYYCIKTGFKLLIFHGDTKGETGHTVNDKEKLIFDICMNTY